MNENNRARRAVPGFNWLRSVVVTAALLVLPGVSFGFGMMGGACALIGTPPIGICASIQSIISNGLLQEVHQALTLDALTGNDSTGLVPVVFYIPPGSRTDLANFATFVSANVAQEIEDTDASIDLLFPYNPEYHCDDELIARCMQIINAEVTAAQLVLIAPGYAPPAQIDAQARRLFAMSLHTLQDFFAHTNWVEQVSPTQGGCPPLTPAPLIAPLTLSISTIQPSPAGCMPQPALWASSSSPPVLLPQPCQQTPVISFWNAPPYSSELTVAPELTSGWYFSATNKALLLLNLFDGLTPLPYRCAHGLINLSQLPWGTLLIGALDEAVDEYPFLLPVEAVYGDGPETGINKDNSARANFPAAYADARYATQELTLAVLNTTGTNPDNICEFMTNMVCARAMTLGSDPANIASGGGPVTLTAVVDNSVGTPTGIPNPTGTVTFTDSNGSLNCKNNSGDVPVIVPSGATAATATCNATLSMAPDIVTATYDGDGLYPSNSATFTLAASGSSACTWNVSGTWSVLQSNDYQTTFTLTEQGGTVSGTSSALNLGSGNVDETGVVSGSVAGNAVTFNIFWTGSSGGTFTSSYTFEITSAGTVTDGVTGISTFTSSQVFACM